MYKSEEAKKEYFRKRYQNNKEKYAKATSDFWVKYTREQLGKDDVTEAEIKACRNAYYREYRRTHRDEVKKNIDDFWKRKAMEQDALRKEFLQDEE